MIRTRKRILSLLSMLLLISTSPSLAQQRTLSLDEALAIAMANSPDIRRSQLSLERSRESLNAQKAALKSRFSLTLNPFSFNSDRTFNTFFSEWSSNETTESMGTFTISQPIASVDGTLSLNNRLSWQDSYSEYQDKRDKSFNNSLYLSYTQPIFTYNRTKLATRTLELDLESTLLNYAIRKISLELDVAQSFYQVYQNKLALEIAIEEMNNQEASYNIIKNKVDAGIAALEELYQAELNLATSKSSVQNSEVTLENSLDNFKVLISLQLWENITVDVNVDTQPVDVDLDTAVENGLKNRMELRQLMISLENSGFDLTRIKALNEFKGNVNLSLGVIGTDQTFGNVYDTPTNRRGIGISFAIPLWDWGESKSRLKAAQAQYESQKLSLEEENNSITLAIRQAYRNLNNLVNQIDIEQQNVRNAQLTYDINLERYKNGDLTSMDLNLYQAQLSQRKTGLLRSQINYKLALLSMKVQSLWDFERNEAVIPDI